MKVIRIPSRAHHEPKPRWTRPFRRFPSCRGRVLSEFERRLTFVHIFLWGAQWADGTPIRAWRRSPIWRRRIEGWRAAVRDMSVATSAVWRRLAPSHRQPLGEKSQLTSGCLITGHASLLIRKIMWLQLVKVIKTHCARPNAWWSLTSKRKQRDRCGHVMMPRWPSLARSCSWVWAQATTSCSKWPPQLRPDSQTKPAAPVTSLARYKDLSWTAELYLWERLGHAPPQNGDECALIISRCMERNDLKDCGPHTSPSVNDVRHHLGAKWLFWLRLLDGVLKSHWSETWCRIEERFQKW